MLKNTPVKTSVGTRTSASDVFVRVTLSVLPESSKSADADRLPLDPVKSIPARAVAGADSAPSAIAETARATIEAGAVGINLEDSPGTGGSPLMEIAAQQDRIRAVRETAAKMDIPIVINARTDVYLGAVGEVSSRFGNAVARAHAYRQAGADSSFVPGVADVDLIRQLARAIEGPLNVLVQAGMPPTGELEKLGVARVSLGSGPMRAAMGLVRRIASELLDSGTYTSILEGAIPYSELNQVLRS